MGLGRKILFRAKRGHNSVRHETRLGLSRHHAIELVGNESYRSPDMPEQRAIVAATNGNRFKHLNLAV